MLSKKKTNLFFYLIIFFLIFSKSYSIEKNYIEVKVNNNIITKSDIINEKNLLIAYNESLRDLSEDELYLMSKDSLIRQEIKKEEILKHYEIKGNSKNLDKFLEDFYRKLNIRNDLEIKKFLELANLTENEMREKIEIEALWNELIYGKYKDKVNIDVDNLSQKLKEEIDGLEKIKSYFFSEILYDVSSKQEIIEKNKKILKSIEEIGFKNTANIYSISKSAKFGGEIGWVK